MPASASSSHFTSPEGAAAAIGPPLIGALLRMPWEEVRRRMLEHLHAHGFDDLEAPHLDVLQYPGPDGVRPSRLAAHMRVSKQALNYLIGQLERLGYLERLPDPDDLRSKRISLTPRGDAAIAAIRDAVADVESDWAGRLGADHFAELRALLVELSGPD